LADTAKARGISEEDVIKNVILGVQATKKFVEIGEVADFVCFLSCDSASSITGAALSIDGGWTAQ
jgi:3-hydroxybutyrate dehydrogenase